MVNTFLHKSLLGLFTQDYDEETSLLIWDFLFLEGNIVLIKTALAVFGCLSKRLVNIDDDDIESLFTVFSSEVKMIKRDSRILLHSLAIKLFEFNEVFLESKRCYLSNGVIDNIEKQNLEKLQEKMKSNCIDINEQTKKANDCKVNWPYCLSDSYFENMNEVITFLVIHTQKYPVVFREYFYDNVNESQLDSDVHIRTMNRTLTNGENKDSDLLIDRRPHYCSKIINENKFETRNTTSSLLGDRKDSNISSMSQISSNDECVIEDDYRALYEKMKVNSVFMKSSNNNDDDNGLMNGFDPEPFIDFYDDKLSSNNDKDIESNKTDIENN